MKRKNADEKLISTMKIVDYILMRIINTCFRYYQWRINRFVVDSSRPQRRKVWLELVRSNYLIKSKLILGYHDAKHILECVDLCDEAAAIVNPESQILTGVEVGL